MWVGARETSMVNPVTKRFVSPILDPIGNALLMSRLGDLGMAHRHGDRMRKVVALTFDDGPVLGGTEGVLDTLGELGVLGTFFCIGANVRMHPQVLRRAYDLGHIIGGHSMNHGRTGAVSLTDYSHIDDCLYEIHEVISRMPALYRSPWGWMTPWELRRLRRRGLEYIRWDIETPDSILPCPSADAMFTWTLPKVKPGSILVFHDGFTHAERYDKPETIGLLRLLIPALRAQGYEFATIPELLDIPAYISTGAVSEPSPTDQQSEQQHTADAAARSAYR